MPLSGFPYLSRYNPSTPHGFRGLVTLVIQSPATCPFFIQFHSNSSNCTRSHLKAFSTPMCFHELGT